jgi:hypothetical protein
LGLKWAAGVPGEREWLKVSTEREVAELTKEADAGCGAVPYVLPPSDLAAQAAADREQNQADRDYRDLAWRELATDAGACRCGSAVNAACLRCLVARWLASGL